MQNLVGLFPLLSFLLNAQPNPEGLERKELTVDGVAREGLVYLPAAASNTPCPVVFIFHGHGGTAAHAAKSFCIHKLWSEAMEGRGAEPQRPDGAICGRSEAMEGRGTEPQRPDGAIRGRSEAIVVYLQGLPTPGKLTDPEGKKSGWQSGPGHMGDRDLRLVDAVLEALAAKYKIDRKRIFCTGHSNGGAFCYLLWALRGDVFAAVAPMAAVLGDEKARALMRAKPAFHAAGRQDPLVKFEWQQAMLDFDRKLNGCGEKGTPWGDGPALRYESTNGAPFVTYIHPGKHELPTAALPLMVRFFMEAGEKR